MVQKFNLGDRVRVIAPTHDIETLFKSADTSFEENDWIPEEMNPAIGKEFYILDRGRGGYIIAPVANPNSSHVMSFLPEWLELVSSVVTMEKLKPISSPYQQQQNQYLKKLEKRRKRDALYMDIARRCAQESHARRARVGAVVVKDEQILSTGWNGMPSGMDNNCEDETVETRYVDPILCDSSVSVTDLFNEGWMVIDYETGLLEKRTLTTKPEVLHAELNALSRITASTESSKGATLYVTLMPCIECAKLLKQSQIVRVVYDEAYRCTKGIDMLRKLGILVQSFKETQE